MSEFDRHANTPLDKYNAESQLSLDALKDPKIFVQLADEHFIRMDKDGSGGLSRLELYDSQAHSKSPVEREISRVILQNYDKAINLATNNKPAEIFNPVHSSASMGAWNSYFGDSSKTANEFTLHDLYVVENVLDPERLRYTLSQARNSEISMGGMETISAVGMFGLGAFLSETPGILPVAGVAAAGFAVDAFHNFVGSNKEPYHREVEKRAESLESWKYFNDTSARQTIARSIAKDQGHK